MKNIVGAHLHSSQDAKTSLSSYGFQEKVKYQCIRRIAPTHVSVAHAILMLYEDGS